jgi:hypothetical protein
VSMYDYDQDEDQQDEDTPENYPNVSIDGKPVDLWGEFGGGDEVEYVRVEFPDAENGYQTDAQEARPLGWVNSATIRLDRGSDSVQFSCSVGDPRGAFVMEIRRTHDGKLVMHLPYEDMSFAHMKLTKLNEGTYLIG